MRQQMQQMQIMSSMMERIHSKLEAVADVGERVSILEHNQENMWTDIKDIKSDVSAALQRSNDCEKELKEVKISSAPSSWLRPTGQTRVGRHWTRMRDATVEESRCILRRSQVKRNTWPIQVKTSWS